MSAFYSTSGKSRLQHGLICHVRRTYERAFRSCGTLGASIKNFASYLLYCLPWLALALVLYCLPSFGLANSRYLLEILVEGASIVNTEIAPSVLALTLCV